MAAQRPHIKSNNGSVFTTVTTPRVANMMSLLGAAMSQGPVTIDHDEYRALQRLYGYVDERPNVRPPEPSKPGPNAGWDKEQEYKAAIAAWKAWEDPRPLMQAGADRNMVRHMEADGLRIIAWLARFVEPGGDPLKVIVQMAADAGWDVDYEDAVWASDADDVGLEDEEAEAPE